ncbi:MAG: DUF4974 domain-containing protein [Bacteroidetes bacterium]|jgi:ferric-dicitrate binding protein FerR (iron transport regulator)|nr:DUF4974 domain-containing protein [Bacteroidota bacterium]
MMNKKPNIQLLQAYLDGDCTFAEKQTVEQWLDQSPEHINLLEGLLKPDENSLSNFNRDKVKAQIVQEVGVESDKKIDNPVKQDETRAPVISFTIKRWERSQTVGLVRAAATILVITTAVMTAWLMGGTGETTEPFYTEVISPIRTITTRTLPDGTRVELNANSSLKYRTFFSTDERNVYLEGEAFFDVEPDPKRPFKVHSGQLTTTVLGTEFNVKYIPGSGDVEVALVEGRVEVDISGEERLYSSLTLEPNQWVRYSNNEKQMAIQEGIQTKILWRDGILEFKDNTLLEVALSLENWYGVEVEIEEHSANELKITGTFDNESLEHILETLNFVADVEYKIEKNIDNEIDKVILTHEE